MANEIGWDRVSVLLAVTSIACCALAAAEADVDVIASDAGSPALAATLPLVPFHEQTTDPVSLVTLARIAALGGHDRTSYLKLFDLASQDAAGKEYDSMAPTYATGCLVPTGSLHLGAGAGLSFFLIKTGSSLQLPIYDVILQDHGHSLIRRGWKQDNIAFELSTFHGKAGGTTTASAVKGLTPFYVRSGPDGPTFTRDPIDDTIVFYAAVSFLMVGTELRRDRAVIPSGDLVALLTPPERAQVFFPRSDSDVERTPIERRAWQSAVTAVLRAPSLASAIFEKAGTP